MKTKVLFLLLISFVFITCSQKPTLEKPPVAPVKPVTDTYFGTSITDNYRYMENVEDTTVQHWLKAESDFTKSVFDRIDARQGLIDKMYEFDSRRTTTVTNLVITDNDSYFYLKTTPEDETGKLFYRKGLKGEETLLFDPDKFGTDSAKYVINNVTPSFDAKYVAFGVTPNGKELATAMIMSADTKELLPDRVEQCLGITSWLPDNNGFMYIRTGSDNVQDFNFYTKAKTLIHKLNTDAAKDEDFFSKEKYTELGLDVSEIPVAVYDKDCKLIFGLASSVDNSLKVFYAPVEQLNEKEIKWKPLFNKEDEIYNWGSNETDIYLYSPKNAPNFQLLKVPVSNPDVSKAEMVIPENPEQKLSGFSLTKDGIYYSMKKNGVQEKLYFKAFDAESPKELNLPYTAGTIYLSNKGVQYSDFWVTLSGWAHDSQRFRYDPEKNEFIAENLSVIPEFPEYNDLVVEEVMVKSYDGVEVPLSIIHKKDLKKDGSSRLLLFGYGAYGISIDPSFGPNTMLWCLEDGIFAVAHVRGGGELGENWHKGGMISTKPNTWKDFIACAEYMIDNKYTTPEKTAIYGGSAGGVLIGRALTERPDLFGAAIPAVGVMNTLRTELEPGGPANIPEFGTVKDSAQFQALLEMDSYHHLKEGVSYPPTLITGGMNDPRVAVWNPAKFAARMQAINQTDNPVLFRVDYEAGHGIDNTKSKDFEELADILSFALWNTGSEKYQPK